MSPFNYKLGMSNFITSFILIFSLALSGTAFAKDKQNTVHSVRLEVGISDDMKFRAENIPELEQAHRIGSDRQSGFPENGNYGQKEVDKLQKKLDKTLRKRLNKADINLQENDLNEAPYTLAVMIVDAKNNFPTTQQIRSSMRLVDGAQQGGATIIAKLALSSDPNQFKVFAIRKYGVGKSTLVWADAFFVFEKFSKKMTQIISNEDFVLDGETIVF